MTLPPSQLPPMHDHRLVAKLDAAGVVAEDVSCRSCGYNLRGTHSDRTCPECGAAVGLSIVGDYLRFADPRWVEKLARGMAFVVYAIVIGIAMGIVGAFVAAVSGSGELMLVMNAIVSLVSTLLTAVGVWLVTEPDPGEPSKGGTHVRDLARYGLIAGQVLSLVAAGVSAYSVREGQLTNIVASILWVVGVFAMFVHLRRLALRIPETSLADQTRIVMWGLVVAYTVTIGGAILILLQGPGASGALAVLCVPGAAILVLMIWTLVLIVRYRSSFAREAEAARRTWAR